MQTFIDFGTSNIDRLATALWQHVSLVLLAVGISIVLAALITAILHRLSHNRITTPRLNRTGKKATEWVQGMLSALYSIPSLALFALAIPVLGIGPTTAVVVLVIYNQFLLVRNFTAGLDDVDTSMVEAARSLGLNRLQTFMYVQLPLAAPVFIAGIRIATVSTIGIATIAATIDAGGLGTLMFTGLRTSNLPMLLWATILAAGLALLVNVLLSQIEKIFILKHG